MRFLLLICLFLHNNDPSEAIEKNSLSVVCEDGYQIKEPVASTTATSLMDCGIQCWTSSKCYTFSYSLTTRECLHDNHKFKHTDVVTESPGSRYCGTANVKVLFMYTLPVPVYTSPKCPVGTQAAKLSDLEEANQQGLHHCEWGWVEESELSGSHPWHVFLTSQSDEVKCKGTPGVNNKKVGYVDENNAWCISSSTLTTNLDDIDLDSQWILDSGLTRQN